MKLGWHPPDHCYIVHDDSDYDQIVCFLLRLDTERNKNFVGWVTCQTNCCLMLWTWAVCFACSLQETFIRFIYWKDAR